MPFLVTALRIALTAAASSGSTISVGPISSAGGPSVVGQGPGFVVFIADKDTDGVDELYRAELDGSGTTKLSPPLVQGGRVREAWISPDGQYVAFRADVSVPFVDEVWVARADGSSAVPVAPPLLPNGAFLFQGSDPWSPDSQWFAFGARATTQGAMDLYAVRPDGTQLRNLSNVSHTFGNVARLWSWAPDSSRLAWIADANVDGMEELFTAPPTGPTTIVEGGFFGDPSFDVKEVHWSPDGQRLAYITNFPSGGGTWLRTASPTGTAKIDIANQLPGSSTQPAWAPDGSRIAWIGEHDVLGVRELFSALPSGAGRVKVSGPMVNGGDVFSFFWSPTSDRILYRADQETNTVDELFTSFATSGGNVKINGTLASGGIDAFEWYWSPDGAYVAYEGRQGPKTEIWISAADGSTNVAVNGPLPSWGRVTMFGNPWAPDGSRLAYAGIQLSFNVQEIFTVRPDGSDLVRVSPVSSSSGMTASVGPLWAGDSSHVVLRGDLAVDNRRELFAARPDGSGALPICGPIAAGGDVAETYWVR